MQEDRVCTAATLLPQQEIVSSSSSLFGFLTDLKVCSRTKDLKRGKKVHERALESGMHLNIYVANTLVNMYAKCGSMSDALAVFNGMQKRDVVSWNALLTGFADNMEGDLVLEFFSRMKNDGCVPNARTFLAVFKAASAQPDDQLLQGVHFEAAKLGLDCRDVFVGSSLVDMYAKCGNLVDAQRTFERMRLRNTVSWTSLMLGYVENGDEDQALELFSRMQTEAPTNSRTLVVALKACTGLALKETGEQIEGRLVKLVSLEKGMALHSQAENNGLCSMDIFVSNALGDFYSKCGSLADALRIFDDMPRRNVVSWTMIMLGYLGNGEPEKAIEAFGSMRAEGCLPDSRAYASVLTSCSNLAGKEGGSDFEGVIVKVKSLERGLFFHSQAAAEGVLDSFVRSTLVDIYVKCGSLEDAQRELDKLEQPDVVSWTALILGYAESGQKELALETFRSMMLQGRCQPNAVTFGALLKACSGLAAVTKCKVFHREICRRGLEMDRVLANCLVDAYGKCGCLIDAQLAFDTHPSRDTVTWNSLIAGYSFQGRLSDAFELFNRMQEEGQKANSISFICLLAACSHAGVVDKAKACFEVMSTSKFGVTPGIDHYACMVDLLGRANELSEAVKMVEKLPSSLSSSVIWMTVLDACFKWKNVEVGKLAFENLLKLDESDSAAYVLMAKLYGSAGLVEEQSKLEKSAAVSKLIADRKRLTIEKALEERRFP